MKDFNLALYINLGDLDASEIGEKSSHTSRGMGARKKMKSRSTISQKHCLHWTQSQYTVNRIEFSPVWSYEDIWWPSKARDPNVSPGKSKM